MLVPFGIISENPAALGSFQQVADANTQNEQFPQPDPPLATRKKNTVPAERKYKRGKTVRGSHHEAYLQPVLSSSPFSLVQTRGISSLAAALPSLSTSTLLLHDTRLLTTTVAPSSLVPPASSMGRRQRPLLPPPSRAGGGAPSSFLPPRAGGSTPAPPSSLSTGRGGSTRVHAGAPSSLSTGRRRRGGGQRRIVGGREGIGVGCAGPRHLGR